MKYKNTICGYCGAIGEIYGCSNKQYCFCVFCGYTRIKLSEFNVQERDNYKEKEKC